MSSKRIIDVSKENYISNELKKSKTRKNTSTHGDRKPFVGRENNINTMKCNKKETKCKTKVDDVEEIENVSLETTSNFTKCNKKETKCKSKVNGVEERENVSLETTTNVLNIENGKNIISDLRSNTNTERSQTASDELKKENKTESRTEKDVKEEKTLKETEEKTDCLEIVSESSSRWKEIAEQRKIELEKILEENEVLLETIESIKNETKELTDRISVLEQLSRELISENSTTDDDTDTTINF